MATKTYASLEEVGVALNLLGPLCQSALAFHCLEDFHRERREGLVSQDQEQLVFFQGVDLSNLADIKHPPWLRSLVFWPTVRDVNTTVGSIDQFPPTI